MTEYYHPNNVAGYKFPTSISNSRYREILLHVLQLPEMELPEKIVSHMQNLLDGRRIAWNYANYDCFGGEILKAIDRLNLCPNIEGEEICQHLLNLAPYSTIIWTDEYKAKKAAFCQLVQYEIDEAAQESICTPEKSDVD